MGVSNDSVFRLTADRDGARLDKWISEQHPEVSRSQAQHLIDEGRVMVNGLPAKASYRVEFGDEVLVELPPPPSTTLVPEAIPVTIVYEDDDLLVVDKPPGLTVHPAPGHPDHTLANAILSHLPKLDAGDWQRPGIVHRLDRDTSGLIIVAKTVQAQEYLTSQFKRREVSKVYLALVNGIMTPEEGTIDAPIGRDRSHRERMAITDLEHGRQARTNYRVIRQIGSYTFLEVRPETGRTHQIRVHLAAIGHPVVGDKVYGFKSRYVDRQFLHAHSLRFRLPSSGEFVELQSELPLDLKLALDRIS